MNDSFIRQYIEKFVNENHSRLQLYKKHLHINIENGDIRFGRDAENDFKKIIYIFNILEIIKKKIQLIR